MREPDKQELSGVVYAAGFEGGECLSDTAALDGDCPEDADEMTNYRAGADFEREIVRLLKDHGFDVVRAAGSKGKLAGYDADLIASRITPGTKYEIGIVLIQAKRTKRKAIPA